MAQSLKGLSGTPVITGKELPDPPELPDDVKERFHSLVDWEKEFKEWWKKTALLLKR